MDHEDNQPFIAAVCGELRIAASKLGGGGGGGGGAE